MCFLLNPRNHGVGFGKGSGVIMGSRTILSPHWPMLGLYLLSVCLPIAPIKLHQSIGRSETQPDFPPTHLPGVILTNSTQASCLGFVSS